MRSRKLPPPSMVMEHPETGEKIPVYLDVDVVDPEEELAFFHHQWRTSNNPVILIQAFLFAHRRKVAVPEWLIELIAERFRLFHNDHTINGTAKLSLDKAFGFTTGRGMMPPFERLGKKVRDWLVMIQIYKLRKIGFSLEKAAYVVANLNRGRTYGISLTHRVPSLSAKTLADRYKRERWARNFSRSEHLKTWPQSEDAKKEFLSNFQ